MDPIDIDDYLAADDWAQARSDYWAADSDFHVELQEIGNPEHPEHDRDPEWRKRRALYRFNQRVKKIRGGTLPHWWIGPAPAKLVDSMPLFRVWLQEQLRSFRVTVRADSENNLLRFGQDTIRNAVRILGEGMKLTGFPPLGTMPATLYDVEAKLCEYLTWAGDDNSIATEPAVPEPANQNGSEVAGDPNGDLLQRAALAMGESGGKVWAIASSNKSTEKRMREICEIDATYFGWLSPSWSKLLNVSEAAIRKNPFWTIERQAYWAKAASLYRAENPEGDLPEELRQWDTGE